MRRIAIPVISLLAALPAFCQTPAPATAPAGAMGATGASGPHTPKPKSNAENKALVEMFNTTDPDAQIKASAEFLKDYPDTDYRAQALLITAEGYHGKKAEPKAIVAGEASLEADPKSYATLLLLAEIYSRSSHATDLDLNDKMARSDKYAKDALEIIAVAPKPKPDLSDADWENAKKGEEERGYMALGFSALLRRKFDDAKTNFDKAISLYPDALDMLYIERGYGDAKRYDDAIAWIDKATAAPNANDNLKRIAASDKTRFQAAKKAQQSQ
jgi:tetratricopeptide (TPR) repeat protein